MRSTIKIEVNFEEGNLPVIEIVNIHSDDVRDKLISNFLQSLAHTSRWCKIIYMGNSSTDANEARNRWHIIPIVPTDLQKEMDLMWSVINANVPVENPSPEIRPANHKFGDTVKEPEYKDMNYQRSIQNPYPSGNPTHAAYDKGFEECFFTFSKAEKPPCLK